MTTHPFQQDYAALYDALYADKDYVGECAMVAAMLTRYGSGSMARVLDLGCGTGSHSLVLAGNGYDVTGVDRSEAMLAVAREKAAAKGTSGSGSVRFVQGDVRGLDLGECFDAALMMFAVLSYQATNADVRAALSAAAAHVRPGGLLLCDVWYGPAVLTVRPSVREASVETPNGRVLRRATPELDVRTQSCMVHYELECAGTATVRQECHRLRFFFPLELELFLELAGFSLLALTGFPDVERPPDTSTWNVLCVARRQAFPGSGDQATPA